MSQALRTLDYAADLLQKLRRYDEAADLYSVMLMQQIYRLNTRGYWYDRLALLHDFHLKNKAKVGWLDYGDHRGSLAVSCRRCLCRLCR